jgi:glycosyltransferase involved in cell wall biosynthesis
MSIKLFKAGMEKLAEKVNSLVGYNKANKPNLLFWGDSPTLYTGFAQVLYGIIMALYKLNCYNIKVCGIAQPPYFDNYGRSLPDNNRKDFTWKLREDKIPFLENKLPPDIEIISANWLTSEDRKYGFEEDYHGKYKLLQMINDHKIDIVFMLNDPLVMTKFNQYTPDVIKGIEAIRNFWQEAKQDRKIATIFYFPVDGEHVRPEWFRTADKFDIPVTYTKFAKERCKEVAPECYDRLEYIYHGVNTKDFYPMSYEECMQLRINFFKKYGYGENAKDLFLLLNLNRNQPRKDPQRTLSVFSKLLAMLPTEADRQRCKLIMYMKPQDVGCDIPSKTRDFPGLIYGHNVFCMGNYETGNSIKDLNEAYNMCRFFGAGITTTKGEGWGLMLTECYATRLPMFVPNNSVHPELTLNGELATLIETTKKYDQPEYTHNGMMVDDIPRYPALELDFSQKLLDCYMNYPKYEVKTEKALEWVKQFTWDSIVKEKWIPKFEEAKQLIGWKR